MCYLKAGGCFGQTHSTSSLTSGAWVSLSSHCSLIPFLNMPTYNLESFYLAECEAWQYTDLIVRLLFWHFEALTQFWFVLQGVLLRCISSEHSSNPDKEWIHWIITPETFPGQTSCIWWLIAEFIFRLANEKHLEEKGNVSEAVSDKRRGKGRRQWGENERVRWRFDCSTNCHPRHAPQRETRLSP